MGTRGQICALGKILAEKSAAPAGDEAHRHGCELEFVLRTSHYSATLRAQAAGIDRVFSLILRESPELAHRVQVHAWPAASPRPGGYPDNLMRIDIHLLAGVGAIAYTADRDNHQGMWFTRAPTATPVVEVALYWDYDGGEDRRFPAGAAIPLQRVWQAVRELRALGGDRPASVDWQPSPTTHW